MSEASFPGRLRLLALGFLHAALFGFALPPFNAWPLAFLAPIPLFVGAELARARPARCALYLTLGVSPLWFFLQRWTIEVSVAGYPGFVIGMSACTFLFPWYVGRIRRRWPALPFVLVAPVVWVGAEFFRGRLAMSGYPWYLLSHPLVNLPPLAWPASVIGAYGVSMLLAFIASAAVQVQLVRSHRRLAAVSIVCVLIAWVALALVPAPKPVGSVRVGIVQTNIPQDNKLAWASTDRVQDFARFIDLTRLVGESDPDLIVWPEAMFPGDTLDPASVEEERTSQLVWLLDNEDGTRTRMPSTVMADALVSVQREMGVPFLIGQDGFEGFDITVAPDGSVDYDFEARFNSVMLIVDGRVQEERYDKIVLTPFGEFMPYISHWDWLETRLMAIGASGMSFDLAAGDEPYVFEIPIDDATLRVGTPVCFEATVSYLCRDLVYERGRRRADLLISSTNDGWFGPFMGGRSQHMQAARWRCIELGTPMARAANTGISGAIDQRGRVLATGTDGAPGAWRSDGVLTADLPLVEGRTPYALIGDLLAWVCLAATLIGLLVSFVPSREARLTDE